MKSIKVHELSIGVATMNGRGVTPRFQEHPYLIVDQGNQPSITSECCHDYHFSNYRGLSKSRNDALHLCKTKYLLFADDDVTHINQGISQIVDEFEKTGADIITFKTETPDGSPFKEYSTHRFQHNSRSLFKANSIEIAVKVESIRQAGLKFDTRFGLGAENPTGEEIIFLQDAYRAGLNIRFAPIPIVIHPKESSGSALKGNSTLIDAKGAMFGRIFGVLGYIYCTAFAAKHYRHSGYSFNKFLLLIIKGCHRFLRSHAARSPSP